MVKSVAQRQETQHRVGIKYKSIKTQNPRIPDPNPVARALCGNQSLGCESARRAGGNLDKI